MGPKWEHKEKPWEQYGLPREIPPSNKLMEVVMQRRCAAVNTLLHRFRMKPSERISKKVWELMPKYLKPDTAADMHDIMMMYTEPVTDAQTDLQDAARMAAARDVGEGGANLPPVRTRDGFIFDQNIYKATEDPTSQVFSVKSRFHPGGVSGGNVNASIQYKGASPK